MDGGRTPICQHPPALAQRDRLVIEGVEVTRDMMVAGSEALGVLRLEGWVVDDLRASAEIYAAMHRAKSLPQTKPGRP